MTTSPVRWLKQLYALFASWLLFFLGSAVNRSLRLHIERMHLYEEAVKQYGHVIFAVWHQQTFVPIFYYRNRNLSLITIHGTRGDIITRVAERLGYRVVRLPRPEEAGRGVKRMVEFVRAVKQGSDACVAVDGPAGPAFRARPGVVYLSQQTGFPILPIAVDARPKWIARHRWDSYFIPLPFSRTIVAVGYPIVVERHEAIEDGVIRLQKSLDALTEEAQRLGR